MANYDIQPTVKETGKTYLAMWELNNIGWSGGVKSRHIISPSRLPQILSFPFMCCVKLFKGRGVPLAIRVNPPL